MKMDKEFLVKNRFWVLLGVAVPLALVAFVMLMFVVPGQTAGIRKKVEDQHNGFKKRADKGQLMNDKWVAQAETRLKEVKKLEELVWKTAWVAQEEMFTWPGNLDEPFRNGYYVRLVTLYPPDAKNDALTPPEGEKGYSGVYHGVLLDPSSSSVSITVKGIGKSPAGKQVTFRKPSDNRPVVTIAGKETDKKPWATLQEPGGAGPLYKNYKIVVQYEKGKAFGDETTAAERDEFADRPNLDPTKLPNFQSQVLPIIDLVGPVNEFKEPVIQFKGWTYTRNPKEMFFSDAPAAVKDIPPQGGKAFGGGGNRGQFEFFPYVPKEWKKLDADGKNYDSTKDAWTFQENLWVTRELFRQLRSVNDQVATFHSTLLDNKNKPKADRDGVYHFTNPYWALDLQPAGGGKLKVVIRNLLERRQKIPAQFNLKVQDSAKTTPVKLHLKSPPLAAKGIVDEKVKDAHTQTVDLSDQLKGGVTLDGLFAVEQVLNWETAGVRRIDALHIGTAQANSHRTSNKELKSFFPDKDAKEPNKNKDPQDDKKHVREGGATDPRNKVAEADYSINGMVLKRYLDVTPQSRRLPVCLVLVVDQEQVYRVQHALADCKFRFLTTQVLMNRCPESMRPARAIPVGGGEGVVQPPPNPLDELGGGGNQQETNIEIVIYGVITLYERYPPRQTGPGDAPTP
jgi:hypothetical protein